MKILFDIEKMRQRGIDPLSISICEKINENNRRRESCTGHVFELPDTKKLPLKYICTVCGYEADSRYVDGYDDAKKHAVIGAKPPRAKGCE